MMEKKLLLQELADAVAKREHITKKKADALARAFFEIAEEGLLSENFVKIKKFGTFKIVAVSERESVNINTGERFQINGHSKVSFTPDNYLKELVNRPFSHFQTVVLNDDTDIEELESVPDEPIPTFEEEETVIEEPTSVVETEEEQEEVPTSSSEETTDAATEIITEESAEEEPTFITIEEPTPVEPEEVPAQPEAPAPAVQEETTKEEVSEDEEAEPTDHDEPQPKRIRWWRIAGFTLLVLLLMLLSYFAGYFRLLCPCEFLPGFEENKQEQITALPEQTDSTSQANDTLPAVPVATTIPQGQPDATPAPSQPESSQAQPAPTQPLKPSAATAAKDYAQLEGGKYLITGTRQTYTVGHGETLRIIAERVYGSRGYAPYIIVHNNIENPNLVEVGTVIKLPKLELLH